MTTKTEWHVFFGGIPSIERECHIFLSEAEARAFAAGLPRSDDPEDPGYWAGFPLINKVVRHTAPKNEALVSLLFDTWRAARSGQSISAARIEEASEAPHPPIEKKRRT